MGNTKQTAREILEKEFSSCPEVKVIDLAELLTKEYGVVTFNKGTLTARFGNRGNASELMGRLYEIELVDQLTIRMEDVVEEETLDQLSQHAAELDAAEAKSENYFRAASVSAYYSTDNANFREKRLREKFTKDLKGTNTKIIVFHHTHSEDSASPKGILETLLNSAFGVFWDHYKIKEFHFNMEENLHTEVFVVWPDLLTEMGQPLSGIAKILGRLNVEYSIDNYFSANLSSWHGIIVVLNEVAKLKADSIDAKDITKMLCSPQDLVNQVPICVKSMKKGTRFQYCENVEESKAFTMYSLKPDVIYRSVVYDILVKSGKAASILSMITCGIVSFKHILNQIRYAVDSIRINGTIEDIMTINIMLDTCANKISTKEEFRDE